jgi:predicted RNA-binding protein YlxR (DUF448 family)
MVRLVVGDDEVVFDLAGSTFGRGAHVHPTAECIGRAPRGLSRSMRREVRTSARALGEALLAAADRRMSGLLVAARRQGALAVGAAAAKEAMAKDAPLVLVACDAGAVASTEEVGRMVAAGRAIAWSDRDTLGGLLGGSETGGAVAICAVQHRAIAEELKKTRAAADAGAAAAKDGARWNLSPEGR